MKLIKYAFTTVGLVAAGYVLYRQSTQEPPTVNVMLAQGAPQAVEFVLPTTESRLPEPPPHIEIDRKITHVEALIDELLDDRRKALTLRKILGTEALYSDTLSDIDECLTYHATLLESLKAERRRFS
ncbi:hypothetical protein JCM19037_1622 [Geomicrobium sp. JCM 19037]|uniref:hypothetical protein n=1 Tax=Geomicrobium sp. JCM 19037 TaxID=1460634 RepID=UPI00045F455A|nr:hypothetical protein [Geomicrobium sp. JCM 19037]GAK03308.1 hypothetical protein JCM19037_1622 [Geomicrobium sp. JCM 19037]